jgi:hypothetical protein
MLPTTRSERLANGNLLRQGIEFDRIGRRVAYHFLRRHPGDLTEADIPAGETVRVPASEVLHLVDPVDAGQLRGVSRFAPAIVKLWRPGGAGGVPVRVVRRQPDRVAEFGGSRALLPAVLLEVRRAQAPTLGEGDVVEIAAQTFRLISTPVTDSLGLVLTCEAVGL